MGRGAGEPAMRVFSRRGSYLVHPRYVDINEYSTKLSKLHIPLYLQSITIRHTEVYDIRVFLHMLYTHLHVSCCSFILFLFYLSLYAIEVKSVIYSYSCNVVHAQKVVTYFAYTCHCFVNLLSLFLVAVLKLASMLYMSNG